MDAEVESLNVLASRLLEACNVLSSPPTPQAFAEANSWIMSLSSSSQCWPTCLMLLNMATSHHTQMILSLCLSLVRQNKLVNAPRPELLVPFVRHLWQGSTHVSPLMRQACLLLCALSCLDSVECSRLLDWTLRLSAVEAPLALHVLQDIAYESFHRPLQSKPLSKLLRDHSSEVLAFLEACARDSSLSHFALSCFQQWTHAGVVLSDLLEMPQLASALLDGLSSDSPALAAELLFELISSVECLPGRDVVASQLLHHLSSTTLPRLCEEAIPDQMRASRLQPLARVVSALLKSESALLAQAHSLGVSEALLRPLLVECIRITSPATATGNSHPLCEALLHPAGWRALAARAGRAGTFLGSPCFELVLSASVNAAAVCDVAGEEEELFVWRGDELRETMCVAVREVGEPHACECLSAALSHGWARVSSAEAILFCFVTALRSVGEAVSPCWEPPLVAVLSSLTSTAAADDGSAACSIAVLRAGVELAAVAAEVVCVVEGRGVELLDAAAHLCCTLAARPELGAATALVRICRAAGLRVLQSAVCEMIVSAGSGAAGGCCVWLACWGSAHAVDGLTAQRLKLVEQTLLRLLEPLHSSLETAVDADNPEATEGALHRLAALIHSLHLSSRPPLTTSPAIAAAAAAATAVLQMLSSRWRAPLQRVATPGRKCCGSAEVWTAAIELLLPCFAICLHAGWLSPTLSPSSPHDPPHAPLPATDETRASALAIHEWLLLLCCDLFRRHPHPALLEALLTLSCAEPPSASTPPSILTAAAQRIASDPTLSRALVGALVAAASWLCTPPSATSLDASVEEELLLPSIQMATGLLTQLPVVLCASSVSLEALYQLALKPFAAGSSSLADNEGCSAGLALLRRLVELAAVDGRNSQLPDARAALASSLSARVPSLVQGLLAAIGLAAPIAQVESAAELLHELAIRFEHEWRSSLGPALQWLQSELRMAGRPLPSVVHPLVLAACVERSEPMARPTFVAMWIDFAQVSRGGLLPSALDRYSR